MQDLLRKIHVYSKQRSLLHLLKMLNFKFWIFAKFFVLIPMFNMLDIGELWNLTHSGTPETQLYLLSCSVQGYFGGHSVLLSQNALTTWQQQLEVEENRLEFGTQES